MTHKCAARSCGAQIPDRLLMCREHWFRVPLKIRMAVKAQYRPGQERYGGPEPSERYWTAVREAQNSLEAADA